MERTTVTVIEPIISQTLTDCQWERPKLKVAAYARVSTEQDEQQSSYEAQVDYYTRYIRSNPDWEFVEVYADEGITGTNTKRREGFNRMVSDAKAGKIDLILTKSISRFARNTVDTLQTVRELKALGVEVVFEKENIRTLDKQCEVLLTIMSSLAQEESRSISENVRWGQQRSMQEGKVVMAYKHFLGYRKGENGRPEIVPEEAEIVREIYRMFLEGVTIRNIARHLTGRQIPTPAGKAVWSVSTVKSILSNEKYKGDSMRQKTYTVDYLSKTVRKNNGEQKQYYIRNSHPAIIDADTFELVQQELAKRSADRTRLCNNSPLTGKIVCGECGGYFGHKVFHGKDKHRKDVWYCNQRYDGSVVCRTPIIPEEDLRRSYLEALRQILARKTACLAACREKLAGLEDLSALREKRRKAEERLAARIGEIQTMVQENARRSHDQQQYRMRYEKLASAVEAQKKLVAELQAEELSQIATREKLRRFMRAIEECEDASEFSPEVWNGTVERGVVMADGGIVWEMMDGERIRITNAKERVLT